MKTVEDKQAIYNVDEVARRHLGLKGRQKLPKKLHDMLQNIFTKGNKKELQYRIPILSKAAGGGHNAKHLVFCASENAIYNALCLIAMYGTGEANKVFQKYYAYRDCMDKFDLSSVIKTDAMTYMKHFCLGAKPYDVENLAETLKSSDFSLYQNKLKSPFATDKDPYDLTPMVALYGEALCWVDYMETYKKAQKHFENKQYEEALAAIHGLKKPNDLRLPALDELIRQIEQKKQEGQEAWELFQKMMA